MYTLRGESAIDLLVEVVTGPRGDATVTHAMIMEQLASPVVEGTQIVGRRIGLPGIEPLRELDHILVERLPRPLGPQPQHVLDVSESDDVRRPAVYVQIPEVLRAAKPGREDQGRVRGPEISTEGVERLQLRGRQTFRIGGIGHGRGA